MALIEPGRLEEDLGELPDKPPVISAPVLNDVIVRDCRKRLSNVTGRFLRPERPLTGQPSGRAKRVFPRIAALGYADERTPCPEWAK